MNISPNLSADTAPLCGLADYCTALWTGRLLNSELSIDTQRRRYDLATYRSSNWDNGASSKSQNDSMNAVLGPGCRLTGNLECVGSVEVHCELEGTLRVSGDVFIEESAVVRAPVSARTVRVKGAVIGDIHASELISIMPGGRVAGTLQAPRISIEDGSFYEGRCNMIRPVLTSLNVADEEGDTDFITEISDAVGDDTVIEDVDSVEGRIIGLTDSARNGSMADDIE